MFRCQTQEYKLDWQFPWTGLALGGMILCAALVFTELAVGMVSRNRAIADAVRVDEV